MRPARRVAVLLIGFRVKAPTWVNAVHERVESAGPGTASSASWHPSSSSRGAGSPVVGEANARELDRRGPRFVTPTRFPAACHEATSSTGLPHEPKRKEEATLP